MRCWRYDDEAWQRTAVIHVMSNSARAANIPRELSVLTASVRGAAYCLIPGDIGETIALYASCEFKRGNWISTPGLGSGDGAYPATFSINLIKQNIDIFLTRSNNHRHQTLSTAKLEVTRCRLSKTQKCFSVAALKLFNTLTGK